MKTKPAYLVIDERPAIVRVTQSWPTLEPGQRAVRIVLDIPDTTHPTHVIKIEDPDAMLIGVGVSAEPPEDDD